MLDRSQFAVQQQSSFSRPHSNCVANHPRSQQALFFLWHIQLSLNLERHFKPSIQRPSADTMFSTMVNTHQGVLLYNALQFVGILGIFSGESENPMPYSKFAAKAPSSGGPTSMVPSRLGMLIIYVPATIVALFCQIVLPSFWHDVLATPAGWLVIAHFLKRDLEVLFLHKYSGHTELGTARLIGFAYAMTSFMICMVATSEPSSLNRHLGIGLFGIGSIGNLYHHYLLAQLRPATKNNNTSSNKKYVAPNGGLFEYVAAPHYLFELIAWLGIAICSEQLTAYLNLLSMTCYLAARSRNQNNWNKSKFDDKEWPASRKNMVPFVY